MKAKMTDNKVEARTHESDVERINCSVMGIQDVFHSYGLARRKASGIFGAVLDW
jgi:hypothetical protein